MNKYKIIQILTRANVELWRDIKIEGFDDIYCISNLGRVWSKRSQRLMCFTKAGRGYEQLHLKNNGKRIVRFVHRLVAKYFVPNPYNKETVNHIDENKLNNRADNLEWMNDYENNRYGSHDKRGRQKRCKAIIGIKKDDGLILEFESGTQAVEYGFDNRVISKCCLGRKSYESHKGFKWYFI